MSLETPEKSSLGTSRLELGRLAMLHCGAKGAVVKLDLGDMSFPRDVSSQVVSAPRLEEGQWSSCLSAKAERTSFNI